MIYMLDKNLCGNKYKTYTITSDDEELITDLKEYIEKYYIEVLSKIDPEEIVSMFKNSILVSDEKSTLKRYIIAEWINLFTHESVYECIIDDGLFVPIERPSYVRKILESVIKDNIDMYGFNSIRAVYLYNKSKKYENISKEYKDEAYYVEDLHNKIKIKKC